METQDNWLNDIAGAIDKCKNEFTAKDYRRYRLDLLLRAAKRVASFSSDCDECQRLREEITKIAEGLGDLAPSSKEKLKGHVPAVTTILKHLQKQHKLMVEGSYIAVTSSWFLG